MADLLAAAEAVDGVALVGDPDPDGRLPHIVCVGVAGVEAEPVVIGLDRAGIAVHSGSACSSESLEPSPVLEAMGVDASRSLRLSVGWSSTDADVVAVRRGLPRRGARAAGAADLKRGRIGGDASAITVSKSGVISRPEADEWHQADGELQAAYRRIPQDPRWCRPLLELLSLPLPSGSAR